MLLIEFEETIFNFSNASVIDILQNDNVVEMKNCDTEIDTSKFSEYFLKFETEERKIYFNKYNFLYMQKLDQGIVRFQFFEKFTFDLMVNYEQLLSQLE